MWPQACQFIREKQQMLGENSEILVTRYLHFVGIPESKLGEELSDLMAASNPTVAPYVGNAEVKVRVAAKAATEEQAEALILPVKNEILQRLGIYYYGDNDHTLEGCVADLLTRKGYSLSLAGILYGWAD
jgi:nicotinamide-nucleotide amidase